MRDRNLTSAEKDFIQENKDSQTMAEIAQSLGRKYSTINGHCLRNDIKCKRGPIGRRRKPPSERIVIRRVVPVVETKPAEEVRSRPPAVYTNGRSPFGIADELHRGSQVFATYLSHKS